MTGRADSYIPLYIGDYLADTTHLSTVEHGAYLLLLFHYWNKGGVNTGGGLPDNDRALGNIARLAPKHWQAISGTIREFFAPVIVNGKPMLMQKRMEEVLQFVATKYDKRRAALAAANAAKKEAAERAAYADADAAANAGKCASNKPKPNTLKEERGKNARDARDPPSPETPVLNEPSPDFEDWWDAYPIKKSRDEAEHSYLKALSRASPEVLLAAAKRYAAELKTPGAPYPKYPQNWLNEGRWLDATGPPNGAEKLDPEHAAEVADKANRLLKRGKYAEH